MTAGTVPHVAVYLYRLGSSIQRRLSKLQLIGGQAHNQAEFVCFDHLLKFHSCLLSHPRLNNISDRSRRA